MKGFAMLKIGQVGWIEKEKPVAGPYDAIVKPLALAPCTSDIHTVYEGAIGDRHDMILGHEAVGEIVEVGSEVVDFKPGDRVIVPAITPDWRSEAAQRGYAQHSGGPLAGWKFSNFKDGVFGEFFHVNDADMNLALLPDGITLEQAVMIPDMVATGFHGAENADIEFGSTVAVLGIGPVGLMGVCGAHFKGAGRIIAVGSRPKCVEVAKIYGATDIVNYKNGDIVKQIMDLTNGAGVDSVITAGGETDIIKTGLRIMKAGSTLSNINYFGSGDICFHIDDWVVGMGHKTIKGGLVPGGRVRMERLAEMIKNKKFDPGLMVTHKFNGIEKLEDALELMRTKPSDLIKPVVIV